MMKADCMLFELFGYGSCCWEGRKGEGIIRIYYSLIFDFFFFFFFFFFLALLFYFNHI